MKKLLFAALAVFSMNAFSQSYMVLTNGVVLTTDKAGFIYDFGHFVMPYQVKMAGGNFFTEDEKLVTIDDKGFLYNKDEKIKKLKGKGLNYLMIDDEEIITVKADGVFTKLKDKNFKKANRFGGNFFVVTHDAQKKLADLYTIDSTKGFYSKLTVPGIVPTDINVFGGNFFIAKGIVHTVSNTGLIFSKPQFKVAAIKKMGGNFFLDSNNLIYTIAEDGVLSNPVVPLNLNVTKIDKVGPNYILDIDGKVFTIDNKGMINERIMTAHDLRNVKDLTK